MTHHALTLNALDGANPLTFLAALGTFRIASVKDPEATLHWIQEAGWRPVITSALDQDHLVQAIVEELHRLAGPKAIKGKKTKKADKESIDQSESAEVRGVEPTYNPFSSVVTAPEKELQAYRRYAEYYARKSYVAGEPYDGWLCSSICSEKLKDGEKYELSGWINANGSGGKTIFGGLQSNAGILTTAQVKNCLFETAWENVRNCMDLRFDPRSDLPYALRFRKPEDEGMKEIGSQPAAQALAVSGLAFLPTFPTSSRTKTVCVVDKGRRESFVFWPIWTPRIPDDVIKALLCSCMNYAHGPMEMRRTEVRVIYRTKIILKDKGLRLFSPSRPV